MKRIFMLSTAILFAGISAVSAQVKEAVKDVKRPQVESAVGVTPIQEGNWLVGGSIGSLGYGFETKVFNITLAPKAGYFVSDGIAVGLSLPVGFETNKGGENYFSYGVTPFARYYFPEGSSATGRFFGELNAGVAGNNGGDDVAFAFGANLGYAHFVTNSVALEVTAGYNKSGGASSVNAQSGLGVAVGFQIYLPGQR